MQTNYKTSLGRSMKILQVFALITICSCTFSCTDDPDPATPATPNQPVVENPPINDNPAPTLDEIFDDIQGAWELKNVGFSSEFGANARTKGEFFDPFIEFLKDSTFLIIDSNENGFRGKYKLKEDVIELLGFGTIEDYSVENDRLIATIKKEMGEESFNIEATKVAEPDIIDEKTEKLVGEWYMVEEIGGNVFLGRQDTLYNKNGDPVTTGKIESILLGFMPSGVNYNMVMIEGKLYMNELLYWKWRSGSDEIYIYTEKDNPPSNSSSGLLIENPSNEELTFYEVWEGSEKQGAKFKRRL